MLHCLQKIKGENSIGEISVFLRPNIKSRWPCTFLFAPCYYWLACSSMLCQVVCSISFADSTLNPSDKKTPPPRPPPPTVSQAHTPSAPPSIPSTSEPTASGKCYTSRIQPSSFSLFFFFFFFFFFPLSLP